MGKPFEECAYFRRHPILHLYEAITVSGMKLLQSHARCMSITVCVTNKPWNLNFELKKVY